MKDVVRAPPPTVQTAHTDRRARTCVVGRAGCGLQSPTHPEGGLQALPALGGVPHLARPRPLHTVALLQQAGQEVAAAVGPTVLDLCTEGGGASTAR